ncbi:SusC/RagA family TonB-linked outer membrane protein [Bacteroidia bacterium]|nr:SusC/RagA family TonB-linked outer membrane protein [Bacteroidia bacterium]
MKLQLSFKRKEKGKFIFTVLLLFVTLQLFAQKQQISGTIVDERGESIIGASVAIKNSAYGTVSDMNGKFSLECNADATLVISYIGYATREVSAGFNVSQPLVLKEDAALLDEVVVVGYGTIEKRRVTSAIASIKPDDFVSGSVKSVGQLLQGKVAGLAISTTSGDPTGGVDILLRGTNTLNGNNIPLILIDGIPGDLKMLAPEDIASLDILKDGSSAAIYGTRATNGVILITTKKGQADVTEVDYSGYISTESFFNKPAVLSAQEWRENVAVGDLEHLNYGSDTDWLDAIQRENTPVTYSQNVSFRGGNKQTSYLAALNYRKSEGIFRNSDSENTTARANINHNMFDNKLTFNLNYLVNYYNFTTTAEGDNSFNTGAYEGAIRSNPTLPITVTNPSTGKTTWMEPFPDFGALLTAANSVAALEEGIGKNKSQKSNIYGTISLFPIQELKLEALLSYQRYNMTRGFATTFEHPDVANNPAGKKGTASRASTETQERMLELTAQFNKLFLEKHYLTLLGGYSYTDRYWEHFWVANANFPTDMFTYNNIALGRDLAEGKSGMYSGKNSGNLIGFFGRLNYSFADKYLLSASLRYEGDSKFVGSGQEWGLFPAVSAAWRINEEAFLKEVEFVNDLKLRVGYGVTGIAPSQYYQSYYRLAYTGNDQSFYYNGEWINMLQASGNRNPEFTWEKKAEYNIGLDFSFFKNRLSGNVDVYERKTKDLLYNYGVPVPPNAYSSMLKNVGTISNRGIEALVAVIPVKTRGFQWQTAFSFSANTNKLEAFATDYTESVDYMDFRPFPGEINPQVSHRIQVGEPIGRFYTFKTVGVDSDGKWIVEVAGKTFNADDPDTYVIYTGEGSVSAENRQYVGNALPKFYAGFNNTFSYKHIDLGITMRGAFGHQILNYQRALYGMVDPGKAVFNVLASAYDKQPVKLGDGIGTSVVPVNSMTMNSFFVEDADYWKIDNITLGYTFNTTKVTWLKNARIYASVLNAFCFTGYSGNDPEVGTGGLIPGIDWAAKYPTTRVYTMGFNLKF